MRHAVTRIGATEKLQHFDGLFEVERFELVIPNFNAKTLQFRGAFTQGISAGGACSSLLIALVIRLIDSQRGPGIGKVRVQLDRALDAGLGKHVVLADAGYGDITDFREQVSERGLPFVVGVSSVLVAWPPEAQLRLPPPSATGRKPTRLRDDSHPPKSIAKIAEGLRFSTVRWREGSRGWQASRFAAAWVHTAHRHGTGAKPGPGIWLLVEWPSEEKAPTRYWLSSLPEGTSLRTLVRLAKLRWRVERDYQDMKGEVGLDHYEGRTWPGFQHHVTLVAVAHAFLALRRALFPPDEMDAPGGPTPASAGPAALARRLSDVPAPL